MTPAADEIVTVPTPDVPSGNTRTTSPALTVIARHLATIASPEVPAAPLAFAACVPEPS